MKNLPQTPNDASDVFAAGVALITHPAVIGILGIIIVILNFTENTQERWFYLALLTLLTFLPAALYLFVYFKGNIMEMLELIEREARLVPYILMIIGAIGAIFVLDWLRAPRPIFILTLILLANEVILGTLNFWTKVSIHTATPTFIAITLGYLISPGWYALLFLVPLIAWARVYRKRHSVKQVVGGALFAGLITGFIVVSNWLIR